MITIFLIFWWKTALYAKVLISTDETIRFRIHFYCIFWWYFNGFGFSTFQECSSSSFSSILYKYTLHMVLFLSFHSLCVCFFFFYFSVNLKYECHTYTFISAHYIFFHSFQWHVETQTIAIIRNIKNKAKNEWKYASENLILLRCYVKLWSSLTFS